MQVNPDPKPWIVILFPGDRWNRSGHESMSGRSPSSENSKPRFQALTLTMHAGYFLRPDRSAGRGVERIARHKGGPRTDAAPIQPAAAPLEVRGKPGVIAAIGASPEHRVEKDILPPGLRGLRGDAGDAPFNGMKSRPAGLSGRDEENLNPMEEASPDNA